MPARHEPKPLASPDDCASCGVAREWNVPWQWSNAQGAGLCAGCTAKGIRRHKEEQPEQYPGQFLNPIAHRYHLLP